MHVLFAKDQATGFPYIEHPYEQQLPYPALYQDVRLWSFPLRADYWALKKIVDRYLNLCRQHRFSPVWSSVQQTSMVFLMILSYGCMRCLQHPYKNWGYLSQTETFFAIPVVRRVWGWPVNLALFCPLIFVDNPLSLVGGNMVLGYPKGLACFEKPCADPLSGCPTRVKIHAFEKHHKKSKMDWRCLFEIQLSDGPASLPWIEPERLWPFGPIDPLFGPRGHFPVTRRIFHLFRYFDVRDVIFSVQLKQIRDLLHPWRASLQELVSIPMRLQHLCGGGFLPPVKIRIPANAGLDIPWYLGLEAEGCVVEPVLPYFIHLDMASGYPRVLHPRRGA